MNQQYILSIDQGTTGTTVSLLTTQGKIKATLGKDFKQIFPKPGWVEHNPNDIWNSTVTTIKAVLTKAKASPKSIAAIGITNQRETVMAWNKKTGEPVGNAIVWQCRRTTEACVHLKKQGYEEKIHGITGLVLDPYFSATKMQWILNNNSEAKNLASQSQLCFGTVDSFLIWKLTGGEVFATDVSNASRTMLMDLSSLQYSEELLRIFSLNRSMLPDIKPSGGFFGKTAKVRNLVSGIPITGVIGDQQSALFGQMCFSVGDAKITYGTGSFLLMNTKKEKIMSPNGLLTTVAWQLPGEGAADYALEGGAFICGAAVQWLRDNLGIIKKSADIENLAKKVKDTAGVQFYPTFAGLSAPYWEPKVQGSFFGLTRGTKNEHIARACLEAMALQNVDIVETMAKDARTNLSHVRVDGGASANNLLMQMQADFVGVNVIRPKIIESTSRGAALMAGLGVGLWSMSDLKKLDQVDKSFAPKMDEKARDSRLNEWRKGIKAMRLYYS